jgi:hypothetical protein
MKHDHRQFDDALGAIEGAVLPGLSRLLDSLIDSAALARPGHDAEAFARGIRGSAAEIEALTRLLAAMAQPADSTSA